MLLVSSGTDLKLHNCLAYDLVYVYRPSDSPGQIRNISWCKDGSWLALVPSHGNAEIIQTKDDVRLFQTILGVPQPTATVFQRTTKRNVAMSTVNGSVLIYDIKAKCVKKRFVNTGSSVTMLDWSLQDTHLVGGSTDGQITVFNNTTNQKTSVFTVPESRSVSVVRFHSTERPILGTASDEGVVAVWDINNARQKMCLKTHKAPVTDLVFSSQNCKLMVSVGLDRTFQCYDIHAGSMALSVMTDHPLSSVDMSPDGFTIAAASSRGTIYIYDLRQHETPLKIIAAHSGEIKKVLYQPYALDSTDLIQIPEEKLVYTNLEPKSSSASIDSFTNIISNVSELSMKLYEDNSNESIIKDGRNSAAGDSFLNDLNSSTKIMTDSFVREKSTLGLSESIKKWLDARKNNLEPQSPSLNSSEKMSDIPDANIKLTSSTPNRVSSNKMDEFSSDISPILANGLSMSNDELSKIVSNTLKEELQKVLNSTVKEVVRTVVKEEISALKDSLSKFFLTLQLVLSKQFVGQESHMEKLFDCYCGSTANSSETQLHDLEQMNKFLRSKINELLCKNES